MMPSAINDCRLLTRTLILTRFIFLFSIRDKGDNNT
jgi:hypothetical protein